MWLGIFIISFIVEVTTLSLVTIWFSAGALVALFIEYIGVSISGQLIGFIITSILTFLVFRPMIMKHIKSPGIKTNADSLIGKTGEVIEDITKLSYGQVKVNGQIWTAKSMEGVDIKKGSIVDILEIQGVKLMVSEKEREVV